MSAHSFRTPGTLVAAGVAAIGIFAWSGHDGRVEAVKRADPAVVTATLKDQTDLSVTVYNSNIALVRDVRQVALPSGTLDLQLSRHRRDGEPGDACTSARSASRRSSAILEQNYQFDLLDPRAAAEEVRRPRRHARAHAQRERHDDAGRSDGAPARLQRRAGLADRQRDRHRLCTPSSTASPRFPRTCTAARRSSGSSTTAAQREHRIETSYLAGNMSWIADYVLTVGRDDQHADLDGWVTVSNTSGTSYRNAQAAARRRRAESRATGGRLDERGVMAKAAREAAAAPRPSRAKRSPSTTSTRSNRRTTLEENETKQISLLERHRRSGEEAVRRQRPALLLPQPAESRLAAEGQRAGVLQVPQRRGVRARHADAGRHRARLSGGLERRRCSLPARTASTTRRRTRTSRSRSARPSTSSASGSRPTSSEIADNVYEMAFEITLRNHKATPITVQVNEPIAGDWRMLSSTYPAKKTEAWAAQFEVPVAAGAESVLQYRVRVRW